MSGEAIMNNEIFSSLEIDTIGEIMNISMGAAATSASTLLEEKVGITTPVVTVVSTAEFTLDTMEPAVAVQIHYAEGITGSNILILKQSDVRTILAQMMHTELPPIEEFVIDEIAESAMGELMNQMMGASATVLSCFLGRTINISTPITVPIGGIEEFKAEYFPQKESLLTTRFQIGIEGIMDSEFISVMDIDLAREIIEVSLNFDAAGSAPPADPQPAPPSVVPPQVQAVPQAPATPAYAAPPAQQTQTWMPPQTVQQTYQVPETPVVVKDFEYTDFTPDGTVQESHPNLDLVMNVPVVVTVELGRTKRKIKEILEFGQGSIVELDRQAGSQVDVIVNGQLIAKGDVVVVDDNFSIRITEILKSRDSLTML